MAIINIVTHLGDLVVVLPLAVAAMLWFAYSGAKRLAVYWAAALAACMLITILTKMHFLSCPSRLFDLRSPSGHSSLSVLVYGALGAIAAKRLEGAKRIAAIGVSAGLIAVIAVSRWLLDAHTVMEILIGLLIGGAALLPFLLAHRHAPTSKRVPLHLLAVLAVLPFTLAMDSPDTERILSRAAISLQRIIPMCGNAPLSSEDQAQ